MTIFIAGGSGFLGRALLGRLRASGHTVRTLARSATPGSGDITWRPDGTVGAWADALEGADAVVNLSGAGIAEARWTEARKVTLRDSRILSTRSLASAISRAARPPAVLLNASGVGYYGDRGSDVVTEATPPGGDFLAQLCVEWEREAETAATSTRVALLRNGLVLHRSGGALAKMLLPFRLGVGGRFGSGEQYLPWIHLDDWLNLTITLMTTADARGAFNVTASEPVTNETFTRTLARTLRRPAIIPTPAFALRLALGELADTLLTGQRAVPRRAAQMGFTFDFPTIDVALDELLQDLRPDLRPRPPTPA
jgi:uncharacterized protein